MKLIAPILREVRRVVRNGRQVSAPRASLALVLTPLGESGTSLSNYYWTPIFEALEKAGFALSVYQPRRLVIPRLGARAPSGRVLTWPPLVSPAVFVSLIRDRPANVISTEYGLHTLFSLVAARLTGSRGWIFKEHSDSSALPLARLVYRRLLTEIASGTIANTEGARDDVISILRAAPKAVHEINLLVPPTVCQLTKSLPVAAVRGARPVFLFVGRLVEEKNVAVLLDAAAIMKDEGSEFSVCVVGTGPLAGRLSGTAYRLGLTGTVNFYGPAAYDSIGHLYAASDVLVMPTLRDYRSMAVLEAMRFGLPVIDSINDGNAGFTVRDGVNGFLFDPTDSRRLAWAMRQFVERPHLIEAMGSKSRECMAESTPASAAEALKVLVDGTHGATRGD